MDRKCTKCKEQKDLKAFIGTRDVCRLCWHYLTPEKKKIKAKQAVKYAYKIKKKERGGNPSPT